MTVEEIYTANKKDNANFLAKANVGDVIVSNIFVMTIAEKDGNKVITKDSYDIIHKEFIPAEITCGTLVRYATPDELDEYHEALGKKNEVQ